MYLLSSLSSFTDINIYVYINKDIYHKDSNALYTCNSPFAESFEVDCDFLLGMPLTWPPGAPPPSPFTAWPPSGTVREVSVYNYSLGLMIN